MYLFRSDVRHSGVDFPKGSACPAELEKLMLDQGLLEEAPVSAKEVESVKEDDVAVEAEPKEKPKHKDHHKKGK